jgi:choline-glycine betaine transporter
MNTILWILQAILSIKSLSAAFTHGLRHGQPQMQYGIQEMGQIAQPLLIVIAVLTALASIGLVAPVIPGVPRWLTRISAATLAGLMLLSIIFHLNCREQPHVIVGVVLLTMAAFVAYGRGALSPL